MFETKVRFFLRVGGILQPYGGLNGETSHSLVMPWEMAIKSGICRSFFSGWKHRRKNPSSLDGLFHGKSIYPLVNVYSLLLKMAIEIVDLPIKNGDFLYLCWITRGYTWFGNIHIANLYGKYSFWYGSNLGSHILGNIRFGTYQKMIIHRLGPIIRDLYRRYHHFECYYISNSDIMYSAVHCQCNYYNTELPWITYYIFVLSHYCIYCLPLLLYSLSLYMSLYLGW